MIESLVGGTIGQAGLVLDRELRFEDFDQALWSPCKQMGDAAMAIPRSEHCTKISVYNVSGCDLKSREAR